MSKILLNQIVSREIKTECDYLFKEIKNAQERLTELQDKCIHQNTFDGNYSYRVGNIQKATICSDCGSFIKYV